VAGLQQYIRTDCENYFYHRQKSTNSSVKQVTVQNEQSTIHACIKWLNKNGETHIDGFDFKKLPRLDKGNDAIRRATLTNDEYESLFRAMRSYCAKQNKLDVLELRTRKIVQHYVLIAANSGLRVGEQRQLRWSDVQVEAHTVVVKSKSWLELLYVPKQAKYAQLALCCVVMDSTSNACVNLSRVLAMILLSSVSMEMKCSVNVLCCITGIR